MEDGITTNRIYAGSRLASGSRGYVSGLDGLKAFAIAGVTLYHFAPNVLPGAFISVPLFFIITGFLLAYTSERARMNGGFNVLHYFWQRIKRLYPALIIVVFTTIGVYHFLAPEVIKGIRPEAMSVLLGYNNWWQITQNADYFTRAANASPFTHLWFMGVEMQYIVIWPLLYLVYRFAAEFIGRRAGLTVVTLLAIAAAGLMPLTYTPGEDVTRYYFGTDMRGYALLFGAWLGLYTVGRSRGRLTAGGGWFGYAGFVVLVAGLGIALEWLDGQAPLTYQWGLLAATVGLTALVALVIDTRYAMSELFELPPLRWIGRHSYGLYLWQYPVIFLFQQRGWDTFALYPLVEIAIIVLLTLWSDAVTSSLLHRELPVHGRLAILRGSAFGLTCAVGLIIMGYGCVGFAASDTAKTDVTVDLRAQLAAEKEEMERQNQANQTEPQSESVTQPAEVNLNGIACIGDSVMLGASRQLHKVLPNSYIDAEVGRYVGGGLPVAKEIDAHDMLGYIVLIGLGANGPITGGERYESGTRALVDYLGPGRQIFWVNCYCPHTSWQNMNNEYLNQLAATHPNIHIIDWYSMAAAHPEWLVSDGMHPNDEGCVQYARLVHDTIVDVMSHQSAMPQ